ncbi:MAG: glycosyltransferase [Hyphomonadaceae bacterium]
MSDRAYEFGRRLLGPAIAGAMQSLAAHLFVLEEEKTPILFLGEGGAMMRRALETMALRARLDLPAQMDALAASPVLLAKAAWPHDRRAAIAALAEWFEGAQVRSVITGLLPHDWRALGLDLADARLDWGVDTLPALLTAGGPIPAAVDAHAREQADLFARYARGLMGEARRALVIAPVLDKPVMALLHAALPGVEWSALALFAEQGAGVHALTPAAAGAAPDCIAARTPFLAAAAFESNANYDRLEAAGEGVRPADPAAPRRSIPRGVFDCLAALPERVGFASIVDRAGAAWTEITRLIEAPSESETTIFETVYAPGAPRRGVILLPAAERFSGDSAARRIADAAWRAGQSVLEYGPSALCDRPARAPAVVSAMAPRVSVITRTLDRPAFLKRAIASVAAQSYRGATHIIVNDGGDGDALRRLIRAAECDLSRLVFIDCAKNFGMEAAANIALRESQSDYVAVHDDDDAWAPTFLERTVSFLESEEGRRYGGVVTRAEYVSERVTALGIEELARRPFEPWVQAIDFGEMAVGNFYPPIAFLFRRELYDKIGGFDESLRVLGDWDFNLRFLATAEIALLDETLAFYHHRDSGEGGFANTVIGRRDEHIAMTAFVRGKLARRWSLEGKTDAAALIRLGGVVAEERRARRDIMRMLAETRAAVATLHAQAPPPPAPTVSSPQNPQPIPEPIEKAPLPMPVSTLEPALTAIDDAPWIALQRLARAIALGDSAVLTAIGMAPPPLGLRRRLVRLAARLLGAGPVLFAHGAWAVNTALTPGAMAYLVQLREEPYRQIEPPPDFDEPRYLEENPDVAEAVAAGTLTSGFEHYYYTGRHEKRRRPALDAPN